MRREPRQFHYGEAVPERWETMPDGDEKRHEYMASRAWALKRNAVFRRCNCICERCNSNAANAVHHLTYIRLYEERLEDLTAMCNACHAFTHGKSDIDPLTIIMRDCERERPLSLSLIERSVERSDVVCPFCRTQQCHLSWSESRENAVEVSLWCETGHRWEILLESTRHGGVMAYTQNVRATPNEADKKRLASDYKVFGKYA